MTTITITVNKDGSTSIVTAPIVQAVGTDANEPKVLNTDRMFLEITRFTGANVSALPPTSKSDHRLIEYSQTLGLTENLRISSIRDFKIGTKLIVSDNSTAKKLKLHSGWMCISPGYWVDITQHYALYKASDATLIEAPETTQKTDHLLKLTPLEVIRAIHAKGAHYATLVTNNGESPVRAVSSRLMSDLIVSNRIWVVVEGVFHMWSCLNGDWYQHAEASNINDAIDANFVRCQDNAKVEEGVAKEPALKAAEPITLLAFCEENKSKLLDFLNNQQVLEGGTRKYISTEPLSGDELMKVLHVLPSNGCYWLKPPASSTGVLISHGVPSLEALAVVGFNHTLFIDLPFDRNGVDGGFKNSVKIAWVRKELGWYQVSI